MLHVAMQQRTDDRVPRPGLARGGEGGEGGKRRQEHSTLILAQGCAKVAIVMDHTTSMEYSKNYYPDSRRRT